MAPGVTNNPPALQTAQTRNMTRMQTPTGSGSAPGKM